MLALIDNIRPAILLTLIVFLVSSSFSQASRNKSPGKTPVLWERVNIRAQDLYFGPGGRAGIPDVSHVRLLKVEKGGHSKKYRIKGADGRTWVAKVGDEAQSETAAVRLLAAIGYRTEINYLVPNLTIPGVGTFNNVRLEARRENVERGKRWKWGATPFENTRQMKGLMLMMAFINNWDMKSANNVILRTASEDQYVISDLGVSFGKTGSNGWPIIWRIGRSQNKPKDYAKAKFVTEIEKNRVKVRFNGKNRSRMKDFTIANARWLADLLSQLSDRQIRDAFRAANYSRSDVDLLTRAVKSRIAQLERASLGLGLDFDR